MSFEATNFGSRYLIGSNFTGQLDVSHRLLIEEYENECKLKDIADSITRPRSRPLPPSSQHCIEPTRDVDVTSHKQVQLDCFSRF